MSNNLWRISLDEPGLMRGYFLSYKIPPPDTAPFARWAEETTYGNGFVGISGYQSMPIGWNVLDTQQLQYLENIRLSAASTQSTLIYMTIAMNDGVYTGYHWVDVSARMSPIKFGRTPPKGKGIGLINVEFSLNAITVINDPAIF